MGGCQATQLFTFKTVEQAIQAGHKIAQAIGGTFHSLKDPRQKETHEQIEDGTPGTGTSCFSS